MGHCAGCGGTVPDNAHYCPACGLAAEASTEKNAASPPISIIPGSVLNKRYEIKEECGRGAQAVVYHAFDLELGEDIALKVLPRGLMNSAEDLKSLRREFTVARKLSHDNICRVYDIQQASEGAFIVMEFLEKGSLKDILRRDGRHGFALDRVIACLRPVAAGLDYAHGKGIAHRDLKSGNILVGHDAVKISDFGLAYIMHATSSYDGKLVVCGTAQYMSPEQCNGRPPNGSSDIYSLGIVAFELLTGKPPFHGTKRPVDVMACHLNAEIPAIDRVPAHVNTALAAAMAKNKEDRPRTARAFFEMISGGETIELEHRETLKVQTFSDIEMVWCPPGTFAMGSPMNEEGPSGDEEQHTVTLTKGFWMGEYPVTQEQWEQVMGSNRSHFKGPKNPVESVSWNDAQEFMAKLNGAGVGGFRLPTEAEWEYACRAGSDTAYCFGDNESGLTDYAWYVGNSGGATHPVGEKKANAWGLHDMPGNVWEWCEDRYGNYPSGIVTDPPGPSSGKLRVLRGGSWYDSPAFCRSPNRDRYTPDFRLTYYGFRVARTP